MSRYNNAYYNAHHWVRVQLGKPQECENCGRNDDTTRYEWANLSGKYIRELSDWARLCTRCHHLIDGIDANLKLAHTPGVIAKRAASKRSLHKARQKLCEAIDCDRFARTKGYCQKHYVRIWKNGTLKTRYEALL